MNRPELVLLLAADMIEEKGQWCQHHDACNRYGCAVRPDSDDAVRWCAAGALMACAGPDHHEDYARARYLLERSNGWQSVEVLNDDPSQTAAGMAAAMRRAAYGYTAEEMHDGAAYPV